MDIRQHCQGRLLYLSEQLRLTSVDRSRVAELLEEAEKARETGPRPVLGFRLCHVVACVPRGDGPQIVEENLCEELASQRRWELAKGR